MPIGLAGFSSEYVRSSADHLRSTHSCNGHITWTSRWGKSQVFGPTCFLKSDTGLMSRCNIYCSEFYCLKVHPKSISWRGRQFTQMLGNSLMTVTSERDAWGRANSPRPWLSGYSSRGYKDGWITKKDSKDKVTDVTKNLVERWSQVCFGQSAKLYGFNWLKFLDDQSWRTKSKGRQ